MIKKTAQMHIIPVILKNLVIFNKTQKTLLDLFMQSMYILPMRLDDENPVFRRVFIPWYDSETACLILIICMFIVFLFGMAGLTVARSNPAYVGFFLVPGLLVALSVSVIGSVTTRLIRRYQAMRRRLSD